MPEASEQDRQEILEAIKAGRVVFKGEPGLLSQDDGPVVINEVRAWGPWSNEKDGKKIGNHGGFELSWSKPGVGFGGLTFVLKDGKLTCDSETMGRKFAKEVLEAMLDMTIFDES